MRKKLEQKIDERKKIWNKFQVCDGTTHSDGLLCTDCCPI